MNRFLRPRVCMRCPGCAGEGEGMQERILDVGLIVVLNVFPQRVVWSVCLSPVRPSLLSHL